MLSWSFCKRREEKENENRKRHQSLDIDKDGANPPQIVAPTKNSILRLVTPHSPSGAAKGKRSARRSPCTKRKKKGASCCRQNKNA
jgi:hypothetical protein